MSSRRPLATIEEVGAYLQLPVRTLYDWRLRRKGPKARRIGRHLRYDWVDVESWLDQQSNDGGHVA